jgi:hypothetical protein
MASNTRRAARRREEDAGDTESNTEGVVSRSRLASESVASRVREGNPSRISSFPGRGNGPSGDTVEPDADSVVEEDKIENYVELTQEQLERRLRSARTRVKRKRDKRELMQLYKEL